MQEDIFTKYQEKIKEISLTENEIYIVNAGRMNNGKSSLFNSLIDQEVFKTDDVRTTVVNQLVKWNIAGKEVTLVDTPGLDARIEDDERAY